MSKRKCGICGKDPAEGFASVGDTFYCHGDYDPEPTCYMRSQAALAGIPVITDKAIARDIMQLRDGFGSVLWEFVIPPEPNHD